MLPDRFTSAETEIIYARQVLAAFGQPWTPDNAVKITARLQHHRVLMKIAGEVIRTHVEHLRSLPSSTFPDKTLSNWDNLANELLNKGG